MHSPHKIRALGELPSLGVRRHPTRKIATRPKRPNHAQRTTAHARAVWYLVSGFACSASAWLLFLDYEAHTKREPLLSCGEVSRTNIVRCDEQPHDSDGRENARGASWSCCDDKFLRSSEGP